MIIVHSAAELACDMAVTSALTSSTPMASPEKSLRTDPLTAKDLVGHRGHPHAAFAGEDGLQLGAAQQRGAGIGRVLDLETVAAPEVDGDLRMHGLLQPAEVFVGERRADVHHAGDARRRRRPGPWRTR